MEQKSFDFNHHQSEPIHLQLSEEHQQQLIDLMASLIINVFQTSEETKNEQPEK